MIDNTADDLRFEFGENWTKFIKTLDDQRIEQAKLSLQSMLKLDSLAGKNFLDIGSGSGLFSLVARQLGATVHSFDYDKNSVTCAKQLRDKFFPNDGNWKIEQGSVLDKSYLNSLPSYQIVYSWGVLHHTGAMWEAIENAANKVADKGIFFLSIYNDQKRLSDFWKHVKRIYCSSDLGRYLMLAIFAPVFVCAWILSDLVKLRNPFKLDAEYNKNRGMSRWRDLFDWLGGYPFEVASPEAIVDFLVKRGFLLTKIKTRDGKLGCNEFVFVKQ